jgi:hypothetical protein
MRLGVFDRTLYSSIDCRRAVVTIKEEAILLYTNCPWISSSVDFQLPFTPFSSIHTPLPATIRLVRFPFTQNSALFLSLFLSLSNRQGFVALNESNTLVFTSQVNHVETNKNIT